MFKPLGNKLAPASAIKGESVPEGVGAEGAVLLPLELDKAKAIGPVTPLSTELAPIIMQP